MSMVMWHASIVQKANPLAYLAFLALAFHSSSIICTLQGLKNVGGRLRVR